MSDQSLLEGPTHAGRDKLLDGAIRCLNDHGLHNTTVRMIAEYAGVAPGLVRHHFGGKDNLLEECFRWLNDRAMVRIEAAMETAERDVGLAVQQLFLAYFPSDTSEQVHMRVLVTFWSASLSQEEMAELQSACYRRMDELLVKFVDSFIPDVPDSALLADSFAAMMKGFWFRCYTEPQNMTPERVMAAASQMTGLLVKASSP
ncbi:MAG: TetR family transcriptional regulator C-terminal domain-containing protein [Pseudomonadota bacterium]